MIDVAAGKEKQLLQIPGQQQPAPDAVFRVGDVGEDLRLHRCCHLRQRLTLPIERHVLEEQCQAIKRLGQAKLAHRGAFAVDLDEPRLVVGIPGCDPKCRPLEIGQRLDREDEAEHRVAAAGRRSFLPAHRVAKHQRQLAAAAEKPAALDGAGQRGIANQSRRAQRVGRHQQLVERHRVGASIREVVNDAALGIHLFDLGSEPDVDADLPIDLRQLLGHPPDTWFDEAVVTIEDRTGVHHREGEGRVRLVQRYRPALGHRHPHVDLGVIGGEVMVEQVDGAAADPQPGERLAQAVPGGGKTGRRGGAITLLQVGHDPRLIGAKAGDIAALAPPGFQLPVQLLRVAVYPGAGILRGEVDALGQVRHVGLEPLRQAGFAKNELRHQAEDGGPEGVALGMAVDGRDL